MPSVTADTGHAVTMRSHDGGSVEHVVPRFHPSVSMAAERVVLVPVLMPGSGRPRMLVHVWYDFDNPGGAQVVPAGFPEHRGERSFHQMSAGGAHTYGKVSQSQSSRGNLPTIHRFSARVAKRWLPVRRHPGVASYRRWFTFGLPLPARGRVRLHNQYIATIGQELHYTVGSGVAEELRATYSFEYLLHTGATPTPVR